MSETLRLLVSIWSCTERGLKHQFADGVLAFCTERMAPEPTVVES